MIDRFYVSLTCVQANLHKPSHSRSGPIPAKRLSITLVGRPNIVGVRKASRGRLLFALLKFGVFSFLFLIKYHF